MKAQVRLPGGRVVEANVSDIDLDQEVIVRKDGTRYTEADAEGDAAELMKRGPGKPSLSGGGTSPQIGVRLSSDLRGRLADRAAQDGVRESEIVREALEAFLAAG